MPIDWGELDESTAVEDRLRPIELEGATEKVVKGAAKLGFGIARTKSAIEEGIAEKALELGSGGVTWLGGKVARGVATGIMKLERDVRPPDERALKEYEEALRQDEINRKSYSPGTEYVDTFGLQIPTVEPPGNISTPRYSPQEIASMGRNIEEWFSEQGYRVGLADSVGYRDPNDKYLQISRETSALVGLPVEKLMEAIAWTGKAVPGEFFKLYDNILTAADPSRPSDIVKESPNFTWLMETIGELAAFKAAHQVTARINNRVKQVKTAKTVEEVLEKFKALELELKDRKVQVTEPIDLNQKPAALPLDATQLENKILKETMDAIRADMGSKLGEIVETEILPIKPIKEIKPPVEKSVTSQPTNKVKTSTEIRQEINKQPDIVMPDFKETMNQIQRIKELDVARMENAHRIGNQPLDESNIVTDSKTKLKEYQKTAPVNTTVELIKPPVERIITKIELDKEVILDDNGKPFPNDTLYDYFEDIRGPFKTASNVNSLLDAYKVELTPEGIGIAIGENKYLTTGKGKLRKTLIFDSAKAAVDYIDSFQIIENEGKYYIGKEITRAASNELRELIKTNEPEIAGVELKNIDKGEVSVLDEFLGLKKAPRGPKPRPRLSTRRKKAEPVEKLPIDEWSIVGKSKVFYNEAIPNIGITKGPDGWYVIDTKNNNIVNKKPYRGRGAAEFLAESFKNTTIIERKNVLELRELDRVIEQLIEEDMKVREFESLAPNEMKRSMYTPDDATFGIFLGVHPKIGGYLKKHIIKLAAEAKRLYKDGLDTKPGSEIWKRTGFFKGKDGKWRFEISDKEAKVINVKQNVESGIVSDFFEHKELFKALPDLANIEVRLEKTSGRTYSMLRHLNIAGNRAYQILINYKDINKIKQAFLHELQHSVQTELELAGGSNLSKNRNTPGYQAALELGAAEAHKYLYKAYKTSMGEIEARLVTDRADLSKSELKAIPPDYSGVTNIRYAPPLSRLTKYDKPPELKALDESYFNSAASINKIGELKPESFALMYDGVKKLFNSLYNKKRKTYSILDEDVRLFRELDSYLKKQDLTLIDYLDQLKGISEPQKLKLQKMYDAFQRGFVKPLEKIEGKPRVKKERPIGDPNKIDWAGDDVILKHTKKKFSSGAVSEMPPVTASDLQGLQAMREITPGQNIFKLWTNPIYTMEHLGNWAKTKLYKEYRHLYDGMVKERLATKEYLKELGKTLPKESWERIRIFGLAEQGLNGKKILKQQGIDKVPRLTMEELKGYDALREMYEDFYVRIQHVRQRVGKQPLDYVENYMTFFDRLNFMEELGLSYNVVLGDSKYYTSEAVGAVGFRFDKVRKNEPSMRKAELNPLIVMDRYADTLLRSLYMSPIVAKVHELVTPIEYTVKTKRIVGQTKDPKTGVISDKYETQEIKKKYELAEDKPRAAAFLKSWSNHIAGVDVKSFGLIDKAAIALNKRLAWGYLGFSARSMLIQPSALRGSITEIGYKATLDGVSRLLNKKDREFAINNSKVLNSRNPETVMVDAADRISRNPVLRTQEAIGNFSLEGLKMFDAQTALATWIGAYRAVTKSKKKIGHNEAVQFADDVVTKTQMSSGPGDISPIQRSALGRFITAFQTFVIGDFNYLTKEVLGIGNANITNTKVMTNVLRYTTASILLSSFFEYGLGIPSPFATPVKAMIDSVKKNEDGVDTAKKVALELIEPIPMLGTARYGGSIFGAGFDLIDKIQEKAYTPQLVQESWIELTSILLGTPGWGQAKKSLRAYKRGGGPTDIALGRYIPKRRKGRPSGKIKLNLGRKRKIKPF